jgi:L-aminopeptidase/D-esterase-like protein
MRTTLSVALLFGVVLAPSPSGRATNEEAVGVNATITAVPGIKVGHHTLAERPTGCTVIVVDGDAVGGVSQRGGAPGTRETDLLDPLNMVDKVNAVVLSGGSAFGIEAATGAVRWLEEHGIGWDVRIAKVPIVPAAILFDLPVGGNPKIRPTADCGYRAAAAAVGEPVQEGSVGAGAGATVGKFADARKILRSGAAFERPRAGENTTIGVVATNARLTKAQVNRMALMADDGYARAIAPSHTSGDGDTIFSLATGRWDGTADITIVGALAAEAMADAVVRAATQATGVAGIPAARDLRR